MHMTLIRAHFCTLSVVCYVERLCHSNTCDCVFGGCLHTTWVTWHGCHVAGMGLPMICPYNIWWSLYDNVLFTSLLWETLQHVRIHVWNKKGQMLFLIQLCDVLFEVHWGFSGLFFNRNNVWIHMWICEVDTSCCTPSLAAERGRSEVKGEVCKGNVPLHELFIMITLNYAYTFITTTINNIVRCYTGGELLMCHKAHEP